MDDKELRYPRYKMTVDDFFERADKCSRCIICDQSWQYDIVTKVFTRMGKYKYNGFKYRYNDGTNNLVDDDWLAWRSCHKKSESCCLDNCGGWGTIIDYKYPSAATIERWKIAPHEIGGIFGPQETPAYLEGGLTGNAAFWYGLIRDGYWRTTDGYHFYDIDFSKYLTPREIEIIKSESLFNPMTNTNDDGCYKRIKSSECVGTEDEEKEKESLWKKINHPKKVIRDEHEITINRFFDLGKYGDIQIQCDEPWQVEILKTVFERMGQETYYLYQVDKYPCYIGPGNNNYKTTVHFDDVDLTEYLTLDEVRELVYEQVDKPIARIDKCRDPEKSIKFSEFLKSDKFVIDCGEYPLRTITVFSDLLWESQRFERREYGNRGPINFSIFF